MIGEFHNLLFLGQWSVDYDANVHTPASPWGAWVILVPVIGAVGVAFLVREAAKGSNLSVPEPGREGLEYILVTCENSAARFFVQTFAPPTSDGQHDAAPGPHGRDATRRRNALPANAATDPGREQHGNAWSQRGRTRSDAVQRRCPATVTRLRAASSA
jgi:hypothetical protein